MAEPKRASSAAAPCKRRTRLNADLARSEDKLNRHWRTAFLAVLAETSNVSAAALAAGVHLSRPYKLRRNDPDFARDWRGALLEGYENLELELLHRLRFGETKDGEMKFDNANALRLLGLHRETVARERAMREDEDIGAVRASLQAKIAQLREQVVARRAAEEGPHDG